MVHWLRAIVLVAMPLLGQGQWTVDGTPPANNMYAHMATKDREEKINFLDLPGFTRSVVKPDHALITPESRVYGPIPTWEKTNGAILITPGMLGAHFTMFIAKMTPESKPGLPLEGVERFVFVLDGVLHADEANVDDVTGGRHHVLPHDGFIYFPANHPHSMTTPSAATLLVIERFYNKKYNAVIKPEVQSGLTDTYPILPCAGEVFKLRKLMPQTHEYDFNIHIMDFEPGEFLNVKEVHYNQHGLLLLEGQGIYRLADNWYPVQHGDAIYMAPFVPQWYAALGTNRSRYFLYKDTNRDPINHHMQDWMQL